MIVAKKALILKIATLQYLVAKNLQKRGKTERERPAMNIRDFGRKSFVTHTTGLIERVKRMTEQELLAVLDMSEDEQVFWFYRRPEEDLYRVVWIAPVARFKRYQLADLAFRLRDEIATKKSQYWQTAKSKVAHKVWGTYHDYTWDEEAKPIHWIIAALIAKGQK